MTGRRSAFALMPALALAACSTAPGTGWSRAPDLSVYSALTFFGHSAREQRMLCQGFSARGTEARWEESFAAREAMVERLLSEQHGAEALRTAQAAADPGATVACRDWPDGHWQREYVRMLRLLEARLGLA